MNTTRIAVEHVHLETKKPFEEVTKAFERQLGKFDADVRRAATEGGDIEEAKAKIEAMVGPSGFMLFGTQDHGALLRLAGQKRKAIQYVVGNPLFALQMTQHDIRASLYAPLRVLIYEENEGKTCVEYDKPSSLFGQFEQRPHRPHRRHARQEAGSPGGSGIQVILGGRCHASVNDGRRLPKGTMTRSPPPT